MIHSFSAKFLAEKCQRIKFVRYDRLPMLFLCCLGASGKMMLITVFALVFISSALLQINGSIKTYNLSVALVDNLA